MCNILEKPGIHTINELVEKIGFDPKLKLPDPPCFLGVVCITDFMGVCFWNGFAFFCFILLLLVIISVLLILKYTLAFQTLVNARSWSGFGR